MAMLRKSPTPLPEVTLEHCNDFPAGAELEDFLRGPGGEVMLHNMCCHELALCATLFGVETARINKVSIDVWRSELLHLGNDEVGKGMSDWKKVAFTLEMEPPSAPPSAGSVSLPALTLTADRCGGNFSRIRLHDAESGGHTDFRLPSAAFEKEMAAKQAADPLIRPYFLQQGPDYHRLKDVFISHILAGKAGIPEGVVGLDAAMEALRLADFLVPKIKQIWAEGRPWERGVSAA